MLKAAAQSGVIAVNGIREMCIMMDNAGPGYYGPAGEEQIMSRLIEMFGTELGTGSVSPVKYVQIILTPETINLLIMQD